jgi:hypothetical protein
MQNSEKCRLVLHPLIAGAEERQQTITENQNSFAIVVVILKYN